MPGSTGSTHPSNIIMPHEEGAPVWVRVGRTDHHARVVSALTTRAWWSRAEPARYKVRWSNGTVQEVESSDVRPDEGGRGRTRRPPAVIYQQETRRQTRCAADGSGGRKKPTNRKSDPSGKRGAGPSADRNREEEKDDVVCVDVPPRYAVGQEIKKVSTSSILHLWKEHTKSSHLISCQIPIDYAAVLSGPRNFQGEYHRIFAFGGVLPRQIRG